MGREFELRIRPRQGAGKAPFRQLPRALPARFAGPDTLRTAQAVHPITDVQIEHSLASRAPEAKLFPALRELGVGATLYGVLSRELLAGKKATGPRDFRAWLPRFPADNQAHNAAVVERLHAFAARRGQTPAQLAIAWALAKQPGFVPLIGARTREQLASAMAALDEPLCRDELGALEALIPAEAIVGTRDPAAQMAHLDSER